MENLKDRIQQIISVQLEFATDQIEREIENYGEIKDFGSLEDMLSITTQKLTKIYIDHVSDEVKLHFRAKELVQELTQKYKEQMKNMGSYRKARKRESR